MRQRGRPLRAQVQSSVPLDEPLFQPFPPEVVFTGYRPFETYEATLSLRNNDTVRAAGREERVRAPDAAAWWLGRQTCGHALGQGCCA